MAARIIVCVTSQYAVAAVFEGGKLGPCREYAGSEEGRQAFGEMLRTRPGLPTYLMVDSVDEDYRAEVLPHVSGSARRELVRRKLKQFYRNTSYSAAWIVGREYGKRRDDHYLFAALSNPELLRPWLEALDFFRSPLAGVYLLPMVTQELVARLQLAAHDLLVVTRHNGGLRQSFFQGAQLKASRISPSGLEHGASASALAADVGKTRLYLNSLRLTARDAKLTALLLDSDESMAELQQELQGDSSFNAALRLLPGELGAGFGVLPLHCPYALHMTALGLLPPANNLAPDGATRNFRRYRLGRLLYAASAAATALALLWAGTNLYQCQRVGSATHELVAKTQVLRSQYVAIARAFPRAPASAENLEKAVRIAMRIGQVKRTPEKFMLAVSRALENSPEITLLRLSWKIGVAGPGGSVEGPAAALPGGPSESRESAMVDGEIRPFQGDYRGAVASVRHFAELLAHDPYIAGISVVSMPLNLHSSTALSGNTWDTGSGASLQAGFKVEVLLKAAQ